MGKWPAAITRLVGAILLEQNDEWAVQRARYMTLETIAAGPITNAIATLKRAISAALSWPIRCPICSRPTVTGLSTIGCDRTRSPVSGAGSIVMRNSASTNSEVIGQITTEAQLSGMAVDCTLTAGRGFP